MNKTSDSLYRQWALLSQIPRYPRRISSQELLEHILNRGFEVAIRTIQRDLIKLSTLFSLSSDIEGQTYYWFWSEKSVIHEFPCMDTETALAFQLAKPYLTPLVPSSILSLLQPHITQAEEVLNSTSEYLKNWPSKIAVINRGLSLINPTINTEVQDIIYQGLLKEKQIKVFYKPRGKDLIECILHPLGLVVCQGVIYLVCTLWKYKNIVQLSLHRFESVKLLEDDSNSLEGFDLASYVQKEHQFSYPISAKPIQLKVLFSAGAANHLYETPLTDDQKLTLQDDGRVLLEGSIIDTQELRWWLKGFGSYVEVIEPASLRSFFAKDAQLLIDHYEK